jgi:hypothetical protein
MNLIFVLEFLLLLVLVKPRQNLLPKPHHKGNIKSSSSQAEVGMYQCSDPV